jgi:short-subunit dehydrogenase
MKINGKNILITGASDGIGKSVAIALAKENANLILFGRDKEKLEVVAKDCGNKTKIYAFDITDNSARNQALDNVLNSCNLDVVINNAGIWHKTGDITTLTEEKIYEVINTNLVAQILLTRKVLPSIIDRDTAIINIISKSGIVAQKGQGVYTASKYGMKGFTDVLREDTKDSPIHIGAVYQSGTNTKMFSKAGDDFPTDTFTNPEDLAQVIVFMLSRPEKLWLNEVHITK